MSACIFFKLPDFENVIVDAKIIILAHILPEILRNILKKVRDLDFEGHVSRSQCRHACF